MSVRGQPLTWVQLFALIGLTFGGDGRHTFALPGLRKVSLPSGLQYCISIGGKFPPRTLAAEEAETTKKAGKTNLKFHYFESAGHSLGVDVYFDTGTLPEGHKAIFEYINGQVRKK